MLTLEHIINIYSLSINRHLVSRREEVKIEGPFKGLKKYKIELWEVENHIIVECVEIIAHITEENKEDIIKSLEESLLEKMFKRYAVK